MDYNGVGGPERPEAHTQQKLTKVAPPGPQVSSRVDTNISRVSAAEYLSKNNL